MEVVADSDRACCGTRRRRRIRATRRRPTHGARSRGRSASTPRALAARPHHLGHPVPGHDPPGEERAPQRAEVRRGGVDPAVPVAAHRQVEHVRPRAVDREIPERGAARELVRAQELGVAHARRLAHAPAHELVERHAARPLGDQREHHVAAVVVGEPLARWEHGGVAAEHREELLGRRELVDGNRHHVVGDVVDRVLVEVVADARSVRQQVFDRHVVADEREVPAEHRTRRGGEIERAVLDQADHRERRQALRAARDREPGVDRVGDLVAAIGQSVRLRELDVAGAVDAHDAGEPGARGDLIDRLLQRLHRPGLVEAESEGASLGVATDAPALSRVDDLAAELANAG